MLRMVRLGNKKCSETGPKQHCLAGTVPVHVPVLPPGKTDRIFIGILPQMFLWTAEYPLTFDSDRIHLGRNLCFMNVLVLVFICISVNCCHLHNTRLPRCVVLIVLWWCYIDWRDSWLPAVCHSKNYHYISK